MYCLLNTPRLSICSPIRSSKKDNPVTTSRKAFEAKRVKTAKENLNKVLIIANTDIRECNEFIKELDTLHKQQFQTLWDKVKANVSQSSNEVDETSLKTEEANNNIFVDE